LQAGTSVNGKIAPKSNEVPTLEELQKVPFGSQRERYASAEEVQTYSGIAPVMKRSGKKKWAHFRWACPKFVRQSFHEWAGHSIAHSQWARSYYQQQRERGKGHHAAVRGLAFKWIRIVFRCWKDRAVYDESRYLTTLAKRNSPLTAVPGGTML
jgi:hypothetical protein